MAIATGLFTRLAKAFGSAVKRGGRYYTRIPAAHRRKVRSLRRVLGKKLAYGKKYASVMGKRRYRGLMRSPKIKKIRTKINY